MMNFRRATLADVPATMAVRMAVRENILENPERVPLSLVESHIEERGAGWVCEDAGEIIGFSFADQTNHSIFGLFIHPDHEGRGIGKHLLDLAVNWLFERGAVVVTLSTDPGTRADHFYQARGWDRGDIDERGEVHFSLRREHYQSGHSSS